MCVTSLRIEFLRECRMARNRKTLNERFLLETTMYDFFLRLYVVFQKQFSLIRILNYICIVQCFLMMSLSFHPLVSFKIESVNSPQKKDKNTVFYRLTINANLIGLKKINSYINKNLYKIVNKLQAIFINDMKKETRSNRKYSYSLEY